MMREKTGTSGTSGTALAILMVALSVFAPRLASAQSPASDDTAPQRNREVVPPHHQPRGVHVFGFGDFQLMAANQTFKAVTGTSFMTGYGGGVEILRLAGPIFLRFTFARATHGGERVIAFGSDVFDVGIPLTITMMPLEIGGGWRAGGERSTTPYVGGGLYLLRYQETSTGSFVTAADNINQFYKGFNAFGGIDVSMGRHASIGFEGEYRTVPNALGDAGISSVYGETDLGGFGFRVTVGFKK